MNSRFGLRKKDCENHWQSCSLDNFKLTKPLIVCLCGDSTGTELEANGLCKMVESLLEDKSQEVDLLGVAYGEKRGTKSYQLSTQDIELFVDNILMPLCKNKETDEILPVLEGCKNLSLITFFTFCHGSTEVYNIMDKFNERLLEKGVSEQDIKVLKKSLFEVNYARECENIACPQVFLTSTGDAFGNVFNFWYFGGDDDYYLKSDQYAIVCDKPGQFCGKYWIRPENKPFGSISIVAGSILKGESKENLGDVVNEEHNIGFFKEVKNGLHPRLSEEGKVLRRAMAISLKRRVENSVLNQNSNEYKQFHLQQLNYHLEENLPKHNRVDSLNEGVTL